MDPGECRSKRNLLHHRRTTRLDEVEGRLFLDDDVFGTPGNFIDELIHDGFGGLCQRQIPQVVELCVL